jgi:hypothetical protein
MQMNCNHDFLNTNYNRIFHSIESEFLNALEGRTWDKAAKDFAKKEKKRMSGKWLLIKLFTNDLHIYTYTQWRSAEMNFSVNIHTIRVSFWRFVTISINCYLKNNIRKDKCLRYNLMDISSNLSLCKDRRQFVNLIDSFTETEDWTSEKEVGPSDE